MKDSSAIRLTLLFLMVCLLYGGTRQIRIATDANLNSLQTRALVLHGDMTLDRYGTPRGFVREAGGHTYSIYGAGVSLTAAPMYFILLHAGARESLLHAFAVIPFAAGAVLMLFLLARRMFGAPIAAGAAVVLGFGTTMWPIGTTGFWQHAAVAFLTMLALAAFFSSDRRAPLWSGLAMGASVFVRPPTVVLLAVMGLFYALVREGDRRGRRVRLYAAGLIPAGLAIVVQNRWIWGSWTTGGYGNAGIGFHGDVARDLYGLLFGWWRGLLVYSPVLVLGFAGLALAIGDRTPRGRRLLFLGAGSIATVVFYARWTTWWGGWNQFGYRYLLDIVPVLALLGAYAVSRVRRLGVPGAILGVVSVATMAAGSLPDVFWWDPTPRVFARSLSSSPLGLAWRSAASRPGPLLVRLALVGVIAASFILLAPRRRSEGG